ncbi:ribonuclease Z [Rubripirellula obstinata]|uniref:Ribonuclease Z n=1 Tax=Rubripirellula obstinata TaxID=406547 RepID=A0A5B1CDR9_9BACT|nr:MBL fold metallo-hydrolase [Rubripirellula obstinata]KAA1257740.1 ribonuclease Z [Rubripirellula obstinata]
MHLHCLGTAGYHPNETRHTSCYFLPKSGIVLDAGSGAFRLADLIETETLDILLSHAHLDHTLGLTFLLDVLYQCEQRKHSISTVRVWGEAAKLDAVKNNLLSDLIFPADLACEWRPIDDLPSFAIGDCKVVWRAQDHPGGSVAYRLDWAKDDQAKRLVYASDTTGDLSDEHADWSRGADVLLHECYFQNSSATWAEKTGHTWTERVADVAVKSQPKHLLLTHINPLETSEDPVEIEQIRSRLDCEVTLATDHAVIEF